MLKDEVSNPVNGYFVYLPDIKVTVNLTQITFVEWNTVADPKIDPTFITTVTLAGGGGFYLTKADTELLWKALQVFNQRQVQPSLALNRIYDLLFWLNNQADISDTQIPATGEVSASSNQATTAPTNPSPATGGAFYKNSRVRQQEHKEHKREYSPVTN